MRLCRYNIIKTTSSSLSLGGERAAKDLELLTEKNINAVVNCTDDIRWINVTTTDMTRQYLLEITTLAACPTTPSMLPGGGNMWETQRWEQ